MNIITRNSKDKGNVPKDIMMIKQIIEDEGKIIIITKRNRGI